MVKWILASNSPRRKQLLQVLGLDFSVLPAEIDEQAHPGEKPRDYVLRVAAEKARAAAGKTAGNSARNSARNCAGDALILAADTVVIDGETENEVILGKPAGPKEAEAMLRRLRGRTHQVYTALAMLHQADGRLLLDFCASGVTMRDYTDAEISEYIASGDPLDKAGAYAIQHRGFHPVSALSGCFTNVVGLPLCRVVAMMQSFDDRSAQNLPYPCLYPPAGSCSFLPETLEEA
jgi:septum formation protein